MASLPERFQALVLRPADGSPLEGSETIDRLVYLAQQHTRSYRLQRDFIGYLPVEILTEIGRYAVLSANKPSSELALRLIAVCKQWRSVFTSDTALWGRIVIHCSDKDDTRSIQKARALLDRGSPKVVWVVALCSSADISLERAYTLLGGKGATMAEFTADVGHNVPLDRVWAALGPSAPALDLLEIRGFANVLSNRPIPLPTFSFPALSRLHLRSFEAGTTTSLLPLLQHMPNLTILELLSCQRLSIVEPTLDGTATITLPNLATLRLSGHFPHSGRYSLIAPLLEHLVLSQSVQEHYRNHLFPNSAPPNTAHLDTLVIESARPAMPSELAGDLAHMPVLTTLSLRDRGGSAQDIVAALTISTDSDAKPVCPLLETLKLSWFRGEMPSDEAIKKMIRSRTQGGGGGDIGPARLRSFEMDERRMGQELYIWLKGRAGLKFRNRDFEPRDVIVLSD